MTEDIVARKPRRYRRGVLIPDDEPVPAQTDPTRSEFLGRALQVTLEMQQQEQATGSVDRQLFLTPPPGAIKAEDWQCEPKDLPWQNDVRCRECNKPMWVRQPERHDVCEDCGWLLREQIQELHNAQRTVLSERFVNPFMGSDMWGQSGSLPSVKK